MNSIFWRGQTWEKASSIDLTPMLVTNRPAGERKNLARVNRRRRPHWPRIIGALLLISLAVAVRVAAMHTPTLAAPSISSGAAARN